MPSPSHLPTAAEVQAYDAATTSLKRMHSSAEARAKSGTAAPLRRGIARLPAGNASDTLSVSYARAYHAALSESLLLFIHLSKSGGTGLCELAKLNGCSRAAAGQSTFSGNCADKHLYDGPWWMPSDVIGRLSPPGLRTFAERSFQIPHTSYARWRDCHRRGRRVPAMAAAAGGPMSREARKHLLAAPPTFFAVEGAVPGAQRCAGTAELLLLRDPLRRLSSFGRELMRWGLLPQPYAACDKLLVGAPGARRRLACEEVKRAVCSNFSLMSRVAPPVYDNQMTRALLGHSVYALPAGGVTREHYLIARERLRSVDVLLRLGSDMDAALSARLGWSTRGLQAVYKRASVGSVAGGAAPPSPPCTFEGAMAAHARHVNRWDMALYEEAVGLEALDTDFFARPTVRGALAAASKGTSSAGCGYLQEPVMSFSSQDEPSAPVELGPKPVCIHKKWRHVCCWAAGSAAQRPMPRLPMPSACVLPPAGALSTQPTARLPVVPHKHQHGSCALSCRDYPIFGLEAAGGFCMCLTREEAARATPVSERECRPSCASSGRLHANQPGMVPALPCGGSEAVALFSTRHTIEALGAAAASRARWRAGHGGRNASEAEHADRCAPMSEACVASAVRGAHARGIRALYVRGVSGRGGGGPPLDASTEHFVYMGCFDAAALEGHGLNARPAPDAAALPRAATGAADDGALQCSLRCSKYSHFGVGAPRLVGGPCLCGNLGTITWRRDAEGMPGLRSKSMRSLT